ncbi:hypothetical protein HATV-3_gp54 [Haloarcula tailed virus 3]|uniref:Uncharacterized protein n=1 Tax=Haloarcula tailed virus 3 TaxID=2877990 RepID=A0AAE8Y0T8_9CAUD|nr:hypothetical protein M1M35_gp54 [Haloarcula tailed virus 3]UBF23404.1 hypothetical protein HATV-3_gp54 [Haloarcula tailed virus 3]
MTKQDLEGVPPVVYWCRHCGYQDESKAKVKRHCQRTDHTGVCQSPDVDSVNNHADAAAISRLMKNTHNLTDRQVHQLHHIVSKEMGERGLL